MTNSSKPYTLPLAVSCTSNSLRDAGLSITFPWVAADGARLGGFAVGRNPNTRACSQAKQTRQEMSHKWRYTTGNRVRWIFQPFVHWWSSVLLSETQSLVEKCYCSQNDVYSRQPPRTRTRTFVRYVFNAFQNKLTIDVLMIRPRLLTYLPV